MRTSNLTFLAATLVCSAALADRNGGLAESCGATEASCFEPHSDGGCSCIECCELVCGIDPECCDTAWDQSCADTAIDYCGSFSCEEGGDGEVPVCESEANDDCNGNGVLDEFEGPRFCPGTGRIPVDLIVVKDPSDSISDVPSDKLCRDVFQEAVELLADEYDVRSAWTHIVSVPPPPPLVCNDWTIPLGTEVPVCAGVPPRTIDDDTSGEEWGDACAVMSRPYQDHLLGQLNGWDERDAVLIVIPISDEGPQNGGLGLDGCECGEVESTSDGLTLLNLIRQARIENVQILPLVVAGTALCLYDPENPDSFFQRVANETGGDVVDARDWNPGGGFDNGNSAEIAERIRSSVANVIASSPRLCCLPEDLDGDGVVGGPDLTFLLAGWGTDNELADLDGDGVVAGPDLTRLLAKWGEGC